MITFIYLRFVGTHFITIQHTWSIFRNRTLYYVKNQDIANGFSKAILLYLKRITFSVQKDSFRNAKQ